MTELVVAMGILSIVLAMAFNFFALAIRHSSELNERTHVQTESRLAVDQLVRELRQAYSGSEVAALETMTPGSISFLSPDSADPYHLRRISYRATGSALERSATVSTDTDGAPWVFPEPGPYVTVLRSVRNTTVFAYRDDAGIETAAPAAVRTIQVTLELDPNPAQAPAAQTYRTTVNLRATR